MPRKGHRLPAARRAQIPGDPDDPRGFLRFIPLYLETVAARGYSSGTVDSRLKHLAEFVRWADARGVIRPCEVTRPILERYQRHLFYYRKSNGHPLSFSTQTQRLISLRGLFRYLARNNYILYNPASELEMPRLSRRVPRFVLNASEIEAVLALTDVGDPFGLRDRAILETFYSTGMRRSELVKLAIADLDTERGTVQIREGKGRKDRIIPIGERALGWLDRYILSARSGFLAGPDEGHLFLTFLGETFAPDALSRLVRGYIDRAQLGKTGSCHLLRHSMATLMLDAGADIRFIQEILGHAELSTTQIYTHVSIRKLKAVHSATHPAERLESAAATVALPKDSDRPSAIAPGVAEQDSRPVPELTPAVMRADLLDALADERNEEETVTASSTAVRSPGSRL